MSSAWLSVSALVLVLAMIPLALKWLQGRMGGALAVSPGATRVVSAVAVGPHQRVVTIEVGPETARVWLTLGVTAQAINCLYTTPVSGGGRLHEQDDALVSQHPVQVPNSMAQGLQP